MRVPAFVLGAAMLLVASTGCSSENEAVEASTTAPGVTSSVTSVPDEPPTEFDRSLPEGAEPQVLGPLGETEAEFTTDDGVVLGLSMSSQQKAFTFQPRFLLAV